MTVSQRDPFDEYRRRREIELMESKFRAKAAEQRQKLEEILSREGEDPGQVDGKVTREMEDFLAESTRTAERMLEQISDHDGRKAELREEIRTFFKTGTATAEPSTDEPGDTGTVTTDPAFGESGVPEAEPRTELPRVRPEPVRPSVVERRPLGRKEESGPVDLKEALARIRRHSDDPVECPPPLDDPESEPDDRERSRQEILDNFDQTYERVSKMIMERFEQAEADAYQALEAEEAGDCGESVPDPEAVYRERIRHAAAGLAEDEVGISPVETAPPTGGPAEEDVESAGAAPAGVTNVFSAEPDEDRDLDDALEGETPAGWDIPVRPPPPGAWIVAKQKEEGAAGLSGAAGDTYLIKKLTQEVRKLNRVYQLLLEKKVVTRAEVEGGAEPGKPAPAGKRKQAPSPEEEDDVVSVEDYDEARYRPILTNEKDFSLSSLVKDVHRLNCLRDVLVRKGVVTEKELAKAK